jgi:hypothetical protein
MSWVAHAEQAAAWYRVSGVRPSPGAEMTERQTGSRLFETVKSAAPSAPGDRRTPPDTFAARLGRARAATWLGIQSRRDAMFIAPPNQEGPAPAGRDVRSAFRTKAAGLTTLSTLRPAGAGYFGASPGHKHFVPPGLMLAAEHLVKQRSANLIRPLNGKPKP